MVDALCRCCVGERHSQKWVGGGRKFGRRDIKGGPLAAERSAADHHAAGQDTLLDRATCADPDDSADADLDQLIDNNAERWRAHAACGREELPPIRQGANVAIEPTVL